MGSVWCWLWPFLLGGLVGWLLCGWLARQLRGPDWRGLLAGHEARSVQLEAELESERRRPPKHVERIVDRVVDRPVTDVAGLAMRDQRIAELEQRLAASTRTLADIHAQHQATIQSLTAMVPMDLALARRAGFAPTGPDDLTVVEGIGPKIAELLHAAGIQRFADLARADTGRLQAILDAAGPNFRLADPQTWPEQAELAGRNLWHALKALQDVLVAGRRP